MQLTSSFLLPIVLLSILSFLVAVFSAPSEIRMHFLSFLSLSIVSFVGAVYSGPAWKAWEMFFARLLGEEIASTAVFAMQAPLILSVGTALLSIESSRKYGDENPLSPWFPWLAPVILSVVISSIFLFT